MQWNEEKPMNILIIGRKFAAISDVKTYTEMWLTTWPAPLVRQG